MEWYVTATPLLRYVSFGVEAFRGKEFVDAGLERAIERAEWLYRRSGEIAVAESQVRQSERDDQPEDDEHPAKPGLEIERRWLFDRI